MNMKRFTARTSREALALVREAFGNDAVVMSNKPCPEGVEVLAMGPESLQQIERVAAGGVADSARPAARSPTRSPMPAPAQAPSPAPTSGPVLGTRRLGERVEPRLDAAPPASAGQGVADDVAQLQMSTLSFQDYVRERMLRRRRAEMEAGAHQTGASAEASAAMAAAALPPAVAPIEAARNRLAAQRQPQPGHQAVRSSANQPAAHLASLPVLRDEVVLADPAPARPAQSAAASSARPGRATAAPLLGAASAGAGTGAGAGAGAGTGAAAGAGATHEEQVEMLSELRSMRGLIEQRFGALAFMEKLQRHPRQALLSQRLLEAGYSPALIRKLVESLPAAPASDVDEMSWAQGVLERNLPTGERESALEDTGGVFALVGATGVGKTTSTAKLAAAFATRHGAAHLGLITLDAYRVGAHEQLRTYGRILGVPVHTAHDRASLEDLLDLLGAKKMVLIDTAGMAQRDTRTRELLDMLSHRSIQRLLVVNSASQGETIEDQLAAYAAPGCRGVILSKLDEAVKLGPALDSMIRHKLKVLAVANGQRVPEDWHRLSAQALVQRSMKNASGAAWKLDGSDVSLIFAGLPSAPGLAGSLAALQGSGLPGSRLHA